MKFFFENYMFHKRKEKQKKRIVNFKSIGNTKNELRSIVGT